MRHLLAAICMGIAACSVAFVVSPADPFTVYLATGAILLVAVPSYLLGLWNGRWKKDKPPHTA